MLHRFPGLLASALVALTTSCVFHSHTAELSGVAGIRGEPIEYQTTTAWGLYAFFVLPLLGDVSPSSTVEKFAAEAAEHGATRMRILDSSRFTYWLIFPPISFVLHPVATSVQGELEGTVVR